MENTGSVRSQSCFRIGKCLADGIIPTASSLIPTPSTLLLTVFYYHVFTMARPHPMRWASHPRNPFNWSRSRKWIPMATSCWVTFIVGLNATSITTAAEFISSEFHLANERFEYNFFAVTAWNAAAAFVPLATLPLLETYGMRIGYVVCSTEASIQCLWIDNKVGSLYSLHNLPHSTSPGPELRHPDCMSCDCRCLGRYFAKLRGRSGIKLVSASSGASASIDVIHIYVVIWGDYGPRIGRRGGTARVAMVSVH